MYNINDIFYLDDEYAKRAHFCNQNGLQIVEIEADEKGRRFQIQEMPAPTQEELNQREISKLKILLNKYKEDVEQVELFGMERNDYEIKKNTCAEIIIKLRELEKEIREE